MDGKQRANHAFELENAINMLKRTCFNTKDHSSLKHSEKGFLWLLSTLNGSGSITPSDIAKKINVTLAAVTHHLNSLEEKKYILRKESKDDRRVSFVSLSKKGAKLIKDIKEKHCDEMTDLIEYLGKKDSAKLVSLIAKINKYLDSKGQN